eukprot:7444555-Pyramimonas_sp.AAC.1
MLAGPTSAHGVPIKGEIHETSQASLVTAQPQRIVSSTPTGLRGLGPQQAGDLSWRCYGSQANTRVTCGVSHPEAPR